MTRFTRTVVVVAGLVVASAGMATAGQGNSQKARGRVDEKQAVSLLQQISGKAARFDTILNQAFNRTKGDDRRERDDLRQAVTDLRQSSTRSRGSAKGGQPLMRDVEQVLRLGANIDGYMQRHQMNAEAEQSWQSLRGDLDGLARASNMVWNRDDLRAGPGGSDGRYRHLLTGTFQIETGRGDDPRQAAEVASRGVPADRRQRTYQRLLARLELPRGTQVTITRIVRN